MAVPQQAQGVTSERASGAGHHADGSQHVLRPLLHVLTHGVLQVLDAGQQRVRAGHAHVARHGPHAGVMEVACQSGQGSWGQRGVGIHTDGHRVPHVVDGGVQGARFAAVGLLQHHDTLVLMSEAPGNFSGPVLGSVVHHDHLDLRQVLSEDGPQRVGDTYLFVVGGDHNRHAQRRLRVVLLEALTVLAWVGEGQDQGEDRFDDQQREEDVEENQGRPS